ncbi:dethiobiotin synthase [Brevibacillus ruminantium]|uniref:ATP-dependent dethiobiotin synthetase BioD n=1 Tax=Brevibacillus ruminantium TaxID=2950604 RepID=A0ABY4WE05_9BACL|nr:dethiobiotin synthase [Brevibacillus ruminantium]USG65420.1 dethiobiotin synthase [Brevibacillus ruminantium]
MQTDKQQSWTGFFVSGTDTGVGKTVVTAGLAAVLRDEGFDLGVFKPVQSGGETEEERDSYRLRILSGVSDDCGKIAPYSFAAPLTPVLAAQQEGVTLTMSELAEAGEPLQKKYAALLVEGAGGLAVPLTQTDLMADFAALLGMPLLLIGRAGLGTINHTILSAAFARQRGLQVAGVIVNGYRTDDDDKSVETNAAMIERYGDVPVLGRMPWIEGVITQARLKEAVRAHVDVKRISDLLSRQYG